MFLVIFLYAIFAAASIWKLVVGLKPPKDFPPGPYLPLPLLRWTPGSKYYKVKGEEEQPLEEFFGLCSEVCSQALFQIMSGEISFFKDGVKVISVG